MKKAYYSKQHKRIKQLELPQDLFLGSPILTMNGEGELLIENHKGIISYDPQMIVVRSKKGTIRILGRGMIIEYFSAEDLKISGCITQIGFSNGSE